MTEKLKIPLKMAEMQDRWLDFAQRIITALILLEEAINTDGVKINKERSIGPSIAINV
jgi:hypothetical protein